MQWTKNHYLQVCWMKKQWCIYTQTSSLSTEAILVKNVHADDLDLLIDFFLLWPAAQASAVMGQLIPIVPHPLPFRQRLRCSRSPCAHTSTNMERPFSFVLRCTTVAVIGFAASRLRRKSRRKVSTNKEDKRNALTLDLDICKLYYYIFVILWYCWSGSTHIYKWNPLLPWKWLYC